MGVLAAVDAFDDDGDGRVTRAEYLSGYLREGIDLTADYLLMREIAWAKAEKLSDFPLIKRGEDLMLEGNFLRTAIISGDHKETWPLCVPRRDVSLPGCALNESARTRICKELAKEFSKGTLEGTVKQNFVKRQRAEVQARSLRKKQSTEDTSTVQSFHERQYTTFQIKTMRHDWLHRCKLWLEEVTAVKEAEVVKRQTGYVDTTLKSVDDLLGPDGTYEVRGREEAHARRKGRNGEGLCRYSLNPHCLRENALRVMYPGLGFGASGMTNTQRQSFTKMYESEVLKPKRYHRSYALEKTSVRRTMKASRRSNATMMDTMRTTGGFWKSVKEYNDPLGVSKFLN